MPRWTWTPAVTLHQLTSQFIWSDLLHCLIPFVSHPELPHYPYQAQYISTSPIATTRIASHHRAMAESTVIQSTDNDKKIAREHVHLPRIAIKFCTQCRWMLRAAYVRLLPFWPIIFPVCLPLREQWLYLIRLFYWSCVLGIPLPCFFSKLRKWSTRKRPFIPDIQYRNIHCSCHHRHKIYIKHLLCSCWHHTQFAQELLSTFGTDLGEVALVPVTGGVFEVTIWHVPTGAATTEETILWDRKRDGGFPGMFFLHFLSVYYCSCSRYIYLNGLFVRNEAWSNHSLQKLKLSSLWCGMSSLQIGIWDIRIGRWRRNRRRRRRRRRRRAKKRRLVRIVCRRVGS